MSEVFDRTPEEDVVEEEYYPTKKVGLILGLSTDTIREWCSSGKIKAIRVNGYWRIPRSAVIEVANQRHG